MLIETNNVEQWAGMLGSSTTPLQLDWAADAFRAQLQPVPLTPALSIVRIAASSSVLSRTGDLIKQSPMDEVSLSIHTRGSAIARQDTRESRIQTGGGFFLDQNEPFQITTPEGSDSYLLKLDRRTLAAEHGALAPTAYAISPAAPVLRVLSSLVAEIAQMSDDLSGEDRDVLAHTATDLVASIARTVSAGHRLNPTGRQALLLQLQTDVRDGLGDPDLSPGNLALRNHISKRYVHSLFGDIQTSPATYIREQRIAAAAKMLADHRYVGLSVAAVAYRFGFRDDSTFIRIFRRYRGCTPGDYRAQHTLESARAEVAPR